MNETLYVCTVYDNPLEYNSRYRNFMHFSRMVPRSAGDVELHVAEIVLGDREFAVTKETSSFEKQFRTNSEMWHKENALNELFRTLPSDAQYIAWVDADVHFVNPHWVEDTVEQLETYDVVQMFSHTMDLGPSNQPIDKPYPGYIYQYVKDNRSWGDPVKVKKQTNCIPGLAWAARKETLNKLGMLIDWAIVGGADYHMATAFVGHMGISIPEGVDPVYRRMCVEWETRVTKIGFNTGYVPGLLLHHWHGDRKNRNYKNRWKILTDDSYDPLQDVQRNWQGLYEFTTFGNRLRNKVRDYMHSRNEDETGEILIP